MLAVEKAKTSLGKAEKKVAKAQALLKSRTAHLSTLESHLAELRASQQGSEVSSDQQQGQPETAGNKRKHGHFGLALDLPNLLSAPARRNFV